MAPIELRSYAGKAALAAGADMVWWGGFLATLVATGLHLRSVALVAVALALRGGLDLAGLRFRWAVVVMTLVRVSIVPKVIASVADGKHAVLYVIFSPLLIIATVAGVMALLVPRQRVTSERDT